MGVFNKSDKHSARKEATIIAYGTCIIGGISTQGSVHIDGKFEGVILEADVIFIGQKGQVIGDVKANNMVVNGLFDGKIDCNEIQILSEGKVIGDIKYNELIIETNGKFEGKGIRKDSQLKSRYNEIENKINNIILTPSAISHDKS